MKDTKVFGWLVLASGSIGLWFYLQGPIMPVGGVLISSAIIFLGLLIIAGSQKQSYDRD